MLYVLNIYICVSVYIYLCYIYLCYKLDTVLVTVDIKMSNVGFLSICNIAAGIEVCTFLKEQKSSP